MFLRHWNSRENPMFKCSNRGSRKLSGKFLHGPQSSIDREGRLGDMGKYILNRL